MALTFTEMRALTGAAEHAGYVADRAEDAVTGLQAALERDQARLASTKEQLAAAKTTAKEARAEAIRAADAAADAAEGHTFAVAGTAEVASTAS